MFANCLKALNRNTCLVQMCGNSWIRSGRLATQHVMSNGSQRLVHSTNTHEIDYLLTKYKLIIKPEDVSISYGQMSSLHHFNRIDDKFFFDSETDLTVDTLCRVLKIGRRNGKYLVRNYPSLEAMTNEALERHVEHLMDEYSLSEDQLWCCPWTLFLPIGFLSDRFKALGGRVISNDDLVLLLLPSPTFQRVVKQIRKRTFRTKIYTDFSKKLDLFTNNLDMKCEEFCDLVHENKFIFYYNFERFECVLNLLKKANADCRIVLNDISVFTYSLDTMKKRVDDCLKHEMQVKTWMLRVTDESFNTCLQRHIDIKKILEGYDNNIEYMANQLECDQSIIHFMLRRYPQILQISSKKLFEKLSFLFSQGFKSQHIIETPKVLFNSVDTILERLQQLQTIDIHMNSLRILTLPEKHYQKVFHLLKRHKESSSSSESESESN